MSARSRRSWQGRAILASVVIPPLVHLVALDRLTGRLAPLPGGTRPADSPKDEDLAAWVDRVLGRLPWPWRRTCLKRSVVLFYLLGHAGRPAQLSIGVRRGPGGADPLAAHAWLVRDGVVILEPQSSDVSTFKTIALFPETWRGAS